MSFKGRVERFKMKHSRAFWIDVNKKCFKKEEIDDDYLKHIIYFMSDAGGWAPFISNKKRINRIFQEAYRREIMPMDRLLNLHQWTLCYHGFSDKWPRYKVDWNGTYVEVQ